MSLALVLCCMGCTRSQVEFAYFNLSSHEIWVTDVIGVPKNDPPGRLTPVPNDDRISENTAFYFQAVRVADKLEIVWQEGGPKGWPGGKYLPTGRSHVAVLTREDLGMPAKVENGEVRLTYMGRDKWLGEFLED